MKIMQINVTYNKGSTGKIVCSIHNQLQKSEYKSVVCYGRGEKSKDKNVYKIASEAVMKLQSLRSRLTGYGYSGCIISTNMLINIIKKENPDIVHLHCLNGYFVNIYKLLTYLKQNDIQTILTLHAEFMYTAGCGYSYECKAWKTGCCKNDKKCPQFNANRPYSVLFNRCNKEWNMMNKAFKGFTKLTVCPVSDWVRDNAKESLFFKDKKLITVLNGINTSDFRFCESKALKEKLNLKDEKIILHVTPDFNSEIKGGRYVLDIADKYKSANVRIIIVGFNGDKKNLPKNVTAISYINNQADLAQYYSMADVTLLTSKKETFSLICAESLCCGTPIVGFKAGGPEIISLKEYSKFVEYPNVDDLKNALDLCLYRKYDKNKISKDAVNVYDEKVMFNKYNEIYRGSN